MRWDEGYSPVTHTYKIFCSTSTIEGPRESSFGQTLLLMKLVEHIVFFYVQFYTGETMNVEGIVGMLNYRPDGETPYMLFFKDGVISEKCVSTWPNLKETANHTNLTEA